MVEQLNQSAFASDKLNRSINQRSNTSVDLTLIDKIANAEESAFLELYQRYHASLFNYLLRLVREPPAAEDLLQEVFLAVWRGARKFRNQASVKTWLYQISHHQAVSWLRRNRFHSDLSEGEFPPAESATETQVIERLRAEQVRRAISKLSTNHRAVIELAFFHELSVNEIAVVVGCPVGTVKSRMSHARQKLSEALQELNS